MELVLSILGLGFGRNVSLSVKMNPVRNTVECIHYMCVCVYICMCLCFSKPGGRAPLTCLVSNVHRTGKMHCTARKLSIMILQNAYGVSCSQYWSIAKCHNKQRVSLNVKQSGFVHNGSLCLST